MASKRLQNNKKKTYIEFLREIGRPTDDIIPLGFRFDRESRSHSFHFKLMDAHLGHVLFDCVREKAVACVPQVNADKCREIAKAVGGGEFSVTLML